MAELQAALLQQAQGWLKPGGTLVYATCSLEREEGEDQVGAVTILMLPVGPDELPAGLAATAEGWIRTDPGILAEAGGLDGFFIARWRRGA
jgi:16S rRNA (cytosine967-C5)-methyltransferase